MILAFELQMPRNNAWNGKWSGAERRFVRVIRVPDSQKSVAKYTAMIGRSFGYDFGDGWCARVTVSQVTTIEAKRLRKESAGFCGYDWMIDSIRYDGAIYGPTQPKPAESKRCP